MSEPSETKKTETKTRPSKAASCLRSIILVAVLGITLLVLSLFLIDRFNQGAKVKKVIAKILNVENKVYVETIVEVKPPLPSEYVSWKKIDTVKMWNDVQVENSVEAPQGELASIERKKDNPIQLEMKLKFNVPRASQTVAELETVNPELSKILPGLPAMLEEAKVSPFFHELYEKKTAYIQEQATRLDKLLSVHNLYDTETILELEHPETEQKALLFQSDMDVVSDGSDGDRWPFLDNYISMSQYYQPSTSYCWKKQTDTPNPLLERYETELKEKEERFAVSGLSIEENRKLRTRIDYLTGRVADLKYWSYLIAEADPFVVMSLSFIGRTKNNPYGPTIGDYAVVIHGDKIYPAIVGDAGPYTKFGEASLRLAKQINPKASPYNRPESDLAVTYIVFPQSREEKKSPPDLKVWREKCQEHLGKIGGIGEGYTLHEWEDIIGPKLEEWRKENDPDYGKEPKEVEEEDDDKEDPKAEVEEIEEPKEDEPKVETEETPPPTEP